MMIIEEGQKYIDRLGRVWGPAVKHEDLSKPSAWAWREAGWKYRLEMKEGSIATCAGFREDGVYKEHEPDSHLICLFKGRE